MQRCPECGYREGMDWSAFLWALAFLLIVFAADYSPRNFRVIEIAAVLVFAAGMIWKGLRSRRNDLEYLTLHPSGTERAEDHIRAHPSQ